MSTCSGGTLHRTWVCYESPLPGIDYVRSFYDSPPGSVLQVAPWLLFSVRGRQFDLAVLNIVWWRVYILDSPMHDWFEKAVWQKARDPSTAFVNAPGSRMTSHDWFFFFFFFLLFFFFELFVQRASIYPQHHITPWGAFAFLYAFGKKSGPGHCVKPLRLIIGLICTLCASHSVRSRKWWQIVRGGSQGAQWNQLSISHFPLFVFSMPHGLPYAPILIHPISDCPALVRTPVKCGGVQRVAQRNSPSVR